MRVAFLLVACDDPEGRKRPGATRLASERTPKIELLLAVDRQLVDDGDVLASNALSNLLGSIFLVLVGYAAAKGNLAIHSVYVQISSLKVGCGQKRLFDLDCQSAIVKRLLSVFCAVGNCLTGGLGIIGNCLARFAGRLSSRTAGNSCTHR